MPKKLSTLHKKVWENKIKQKPSENLHVSYSQLSTFASCQRQWYLQYVRNLAPYQPSIHTVFGTCMHETIQEWLTVMYHYQVKSAMSMNLPALLKEKMIKEYKVQRAMNSNQDFTTPEELNMFWLDGKNILDWLVKKRGAYFTTNTMQLIGVETLLYQDIKPGVKFKGLIDLVFYHPKNDTYTIMDIKTSTSGWSKFAKKDDKKIAQVLLYKEFFAKQFKIDPEKIDVLYFIVKRKVAPGEFAIMERRVQEFKPPSGKIKRGQAISLMNNFVKEAIAENGTYIDKEYPTNPTKFGCRFCVFSEMKICPDAILEY